MHRERERRRESEGVRERERLRVASVLVREGDILQLSENYL